jgi:hypothetical protein
MNRGRFADDPHGGVIHVLGRMLLLLVEIELSFEPPALLAYKGGPEFPSWHFLATGRAIRRRGEILRVVNEP